MVFVRRGLCRRSFMYSSSLSPHCGGWSRRRAVFLRYVIETLRMTRGHKFRHDDGGFGTGLGH